MPSLAFFLLAGAGFSGCQGDEATGPSDETLISLTNPQGGEIFKVGETIQVKWKTSKTDLNLLVDAVDVRFSADSGKIWKTLNLKASIKKTDPDWGNYSWTIPDSITISGSVLHLPGKDNCLLRVEQYSTADPMQKSTLPKSFAITAN
ncbi:MAG: hypothetical protein ABI036_06375 [Fibrobacteria bacterium]